MWISLDICFRVPCRHNYVLIFYRCNNLTKKIYQCIYITNVSLVNCLFQYILLDFEIDTNELLPIAYMQHISRIVALDVRNRICALFQINISDQ